MKSLAKALTRSLSRLRGSCPTSILDESFRCNVEHESFWKRVAHGRWEPRTLQILREHLTAAAIYWDIGAWIGPTVLLAARRCKRVYCLEPDPHAFEHLLANLRLNQLTNVVPLHFALTREDGIVRMASYTETLGDSTTSLIHANRPSNSIQVPGISFKTLLNIVHGEAPNFIKMDVEGSEFDLIPSMRDFLKDTRPTLHLSTHAPYFPVEQRRHEMSRLTELFTIYTQCLDESGRIVGPTALLARDSLESYTSFLFMP
jgi:FkbM family methyltransferase